MLLKLSDSIGRVFRNKPIQYIIDESHKFDWHKRERDDFVNDHDKRLKEAKEKAGIL